MHVYSPFFETLYDEQEPVGYLGRGTHYSVLRAIVFHDEYGTPLNKAKFHDFAILWDEDHDTRVISVIERLYFQGILPCFNFMGERKAFFTSVLNENVVNRVPDLKSKIDDICNDVYMDVWSSEITSFNNSNLINSDNSKTLIYLQNIENLWGLGAKKAESYNGMPKEYSPPLPPLPNSTYNSQPQG